MKQLLITAVFMMLVSCQQALFAGNLNKCIINDESKMFDVSIINLIANPKKFNNGYVRVQGVVGFEFEQNQLYLNIESFEKKLVRNSVELNVSNEIVDKLGNIEELNGTYQLIEGTFVNSGDLGGYIINIFRISYHYNTIYSEWIRVFYKLPQWKWIIVVLNSMLCVFCYVKAKYFKSEYDAFFYYMFMTLKEVFKCS